MKKGPWKAWKTKSRFSGAKTVPPKESKTYGGPNLTAEVGQPPLEIAKRFPTFPPLRKSASISYGKRAEREYLESSNYVIGRLAQRARSLALLCNVGGGNTGQHSQ